MKEKKPKKKKPLSFLLECKYEKCSTTLRENYLRSIEVHCLLYF